MALNLHSMVKPYINYVNPFISAVRQRSLPYTNHPDGTRTPNYDNVNISVQVQALSFKDITQLEGLSFGGARRAIYCDGAVFATLKVGTKGGDLIIFPNGALPEGNTWQAVMVLEQWRDWCKIAITLQG